MSAEHEMMDQMIRVVLSVARQKAESQLTFVTSSTRMIRARVLHELVEHYLTNVPDENLRNRALIVAKTNAELELAAIRREEAEAKLFEAERTGKINIGPLSAAS